MKILVAYYTRSGHTEKAALRVARELDADAVKIEDKKSRGGIIGFIKAGYEVICNKLPDIKDIKFPQDISEYDFVILCAPIWAGHAATPIRTFIVKYCEHIKKTAYIITRAGSRNYENVFEEMDKYTGVEHTAAVSLQSRTERFAEDIDRFIAKIKL